MKYRLKIVLFAIVALLQAACSNNAVYNDESFSYDSSFKLRTDGDVAMACESARRALLGQGYIIESTSSEGVKARKAYKSESSENTFIEMNVVCLPEADGSTIFATGVLTTYALKMSSSAASVGVSAIGSISLPIGQSADSLVKVSEVTIDDKDFYRRFFASADTILTEMQAGRVSSEPAAVQAVPEVAPAPAAVPAVPEAAPAPAAQAPVATTTAPAPIESPAPAAVPGPVTPATEPGPVPAETATPAPEPQPEPEAPAAIAAPAATSRALGTEPEPAAVDEAPMTVQELFPAHLTKSFEQ
jgi:hypothetical protein